MAEYGRFPTEAFVGSYQKGINQTADQTPALMASGAFAGMQAKDAKQKETTAQRADMVKQILAKYVPYKEDGSPFSMEEAQTLINSAIQGTEMPGMKKILLKPIGQKQAVSKEGKIYTVDLETGETKEVSMGGLPLKSGQEGDKVIPISAGGKGGGSGKTAKDVYELAQKEWNVKEDNLRQAQTNLQKIEEQYGKGTDQWNRAFNLFSNAQKDKFQYKKTYDKALDDYNKALKLNPGNGGGSGPQNKDASKQKAIDFLTANNAPVTDANIEATIKAKGY